MSVQIKKAERPRASRKRQVVRLILVSLLGLLTALFIEHRRGERALQTWKSKMSARGEMFDPNELWPTPNQASRKFVDELADAVETLPKGLSKFAGTLSGLSLDESGRPFRGSQQPNPLLPDPRNNPATWQELQIACEAAEPSLKTIRMLMKHPPRSMHGSIASRLEPGGVPSYSPIRRASQALHAASLNELHRGNLPGALENLEPLHASSGVYADEPSLINYMIRIALVGLSSDAFWDALQDSRWTEPQLARLQSACSSNVPFTQIPRLVATERVARMHTMNSFASDSYQSWGNRCADILKAFGAKPPELNTWRGRWQQWVFHPTWSYAWRAQDELDYLRYSQRDLEIVRDAVARNSWAYLKEHQSGLRDSYRRPMADWRFYGSIPFHDTLGEIIGGRREEQPTCPYPDFSRAWFVTAENLTHHEMVRTVIALKRHQLKHGRIPVRIDELIPEFLAALPCDFIDGQPLRYRRNEDGSFVLYSVGKNTRDDGGNPRPDEGGRNGWSGLDWVWPQVFTSTNSGGRDAG